MTADEKMEDTVVLRSQDGVDFVVSKAEAARCGRTVDVEMRIISKNQRILRLSVESDILSKVIHYSTNHHDPNWDAAEFVGGLDHATLFDLVLATNDLQNQALLDLTCRAVADMIDGKSTDEIRSRFGIRPAFSAHIVGEQDDGEKTTMDDQELESEEKALRALHVVRCQDVTAYDPKRHALVPTRFCHFDNFAFFNFDKESTFCRGPPLHEVPPPVRASVANSTVNFISLKVTESDVGFPINVFGTVIARDEVDYRCVYLFRREADDSQTITSPGDVLNLMDPCRGLVPADNIFFEFNLKIKCDDGKIKDFSRGVKDFNIARLPCGKQIMTVALNSWLSNVELAFVQVVRPVEATVEIKILKGPCNLKRVAALNTGSFGRIILYDRGEAKGIQTEIGDGGFVPLARRTVAVPLGKIMELNLLSDAVGKVISVRQSDELIHCKMGCSQLEVKVAWTVVPKKRMTYKIWEDIGDERLLLSY